MGIFVKKAQKEELRKGKIEKEFSYIMGIPADVDDITQTSQIIERVKESDQLKVLAKCTGDEPSVVVEYKGKEYIVAFLVRDIEFPSFFGLNHKMSQSEYENLKNAKKGLITRMMFSDNNSESYHVQLKVLNLMLPNIVGVIDYSAEKVLSGKWVRLAAKSEVAPSPTYIYCIQAISETKKHKLWLHTHGLNRCGSMELEILNADEQYSNGKSQIMAAMADRIISENDMIDEEESMYLARLDENTELVVTWKYFARAIREFPKKMLGGAVDRQSSHNLNTAVIYAYRSKEDYEKHVVSPISIYDKIIDQNPVMMVTNEETARMKALAAERLSYLIDAFNSKKDIQAIVKVGIEVDEEYRNGNFKEHIWYELQKIDKEKFTAELTQQPYYVSKIKQGDIMTFNITEITDWIMIVDSTKITPDTVYLLDK